MTSDTAFKILVLTADEIQGWIKEVCRAQMGERAEFMDLGGITQADANRAWHLWLCFVY